MLYMKEHENIVLMKMRNYACQAIEFKGDMDYSEFLTDFKTISACVFNLSQIGELVSRLGDDFTEKHTHIPWRKMKGLRNKIVHDYEGIQYNIVWEVITDFLPQFIEDITKLN